MPFYLNKYNKYNKYNNNNIFILHMTPLKKIQPRDRTQTSAMHV